MDGLPESLYAERFIKAGAMDTEFPIIIAGRNFGCGSSREHAPIALGAANTQTVIAESFARIFFRNCVATGEVYPVECQDRLPFAACRLSSQDRSQQQVPAMFQ